MQGVCFSIAEALWGLSGLLDLWTSALLAGANGIGLSAQNISRVPVHNAVIKILSLRILRDSVEICL